MLRKENEILKVDTLRTEFGRTHIFDKIKVAIYFTETTFIILSLALMYKGNTINVLPWDYDHSS